MKLKRTRKDFFVPLSSMSDVAFLLLIFIMLVALINYRKEVSIEFPEVENSKRVSSENNLEIWVDLAGNLYLDGNPSNLDTVEMGIIDAYIKAPDTRVHILADKNSPFENIHKVLELLQILQYRTVSFVVKDP